MLSEGGWDNIVEEQNSECRIRLVDENRYVRTQRNKHIIQICL